MRPARHLLHFFALGALLFAAERSFTRPVAALLPPERVAERVAAFTREAGVEPGPRMRALLERDALDEELLAREARRLGLDRDDAVVRERLVSNMRFAQAGARANPRDASPDSLYREALALGMDASDPLVRRRLAARMSARLRAGAAREPLGDATLRAHFERNRDAYREPAALQFAQLCFARDRGDGGVERRARDAPVPEVASRRGDPCLLGGAVALRSETELARNFGASFARALFAAEPGVWTGPIASSQGLHLVLVQQRVAPRDADFELVRDAVRDACIAEREEAALRDGLAALRARHGAEFAR